MSMEKKQEIPVPFNLDDFFSTQSERDNEVKENIEYIDISIIDNFKNHPFYVLENEELNNLKESIKNNGILYPIIIRSKKDGRYELISGHRRRFACQLLGIEKIPCIIKNLTDDEATIYMVDSNLNQREKLLPSEKAFAYKMKYAAIKHKNILKSNNETLSPVVAKSRNDDLVGKEFGDSGRQVQRFIRLTYLIPELLKMVDNSEIDLSPSIALRPAVELSYLNEHEQSILLEYIKCNLVTPSLSQAQDFKKLSKAGKLTKEVIESTMEIEKPNQILKFKITENKLFEVLPKNITRDNVEDFVLKACRYYTNLLKNRDRER